MPRIPSNELTCVAEACRAQIFLWDITEATDELLEMLPDSYGYSDEAVERFRSESRRREWLAVRVLLHREAGIFEPVVYHETGCPYLKDCNLKISISHTSHYASLALSSSSLGLDIEQYGEKALALIDKFSKSSEKNLLETLEMPPERSAVLAWSAKESVYKVADDSKLSLFQNMSIENVDEVQHVLTIRAGHASCMEENKEYVVRYVFMPHFVLTLCSTSNFTL